MAPSRPKKKTQNISSSPCANAMLEAQRLKQQAERKSEGSLREPLLTQCVTLLEQALLFHPSPIEEEEALFDLAEVYGLWGNAVQTGMYERIGSIACSKNLRRGDALTIQADMLERSFNLYRKSHEMYEKIASMGSSKYRLESLVNNANALCDCGDLCLELPVSRAGGSLTAANLYELASLRYSTALSYSSEDVELLTNFGDLNIKIAELALLDKIALFEMEAWMTAKSYYDKAMSAYAHGCSLVDADAGDDLAGLLQNWGAGLLSLAKHTPDSNESATVYDHAIEKFKTAAKFCPTDVSMFIAIGEAYCSRAEKMDKTQALEYLTCAVEEGYDMAIKISATFLDAIVGKGEAHLAAGRVAESFQNQLLVQQHFSWSWDSYIKVFHVLGADKRNENKLKFEEQCEILFNISCVAAINNQSQIVKDVLMLLASVDGVSVTDLEDDSDLMALKTEEWFLALMNKMAVAKECHVTADA